MALKAVSREAARHKKGGGGGVRDGQRRIWFERDLPMVLRHPLFPARSVIKSDDPERFFFARRDRPKYPGKSSRSCRSTAAGYWKATDKDCLIWAPVPRGCRGKGTLISVKKTGGRSCGGRAPSAAGAEAGADASRCSSAAGGGRADHRAAGLGRLDRESAVDLQTSSILGSKLTDQLPTAPALL